MLTSMVSSILGIGRTWPSPAMPPTSTGLAGFLRQLARMLAAGLPIRLERLTDGRGGRRLDLDDLDGPPSASTWLVNGSRAPTVCRPRARPPRQRPGASAIPDPGPTMSTARTTSMETARSTPTESRDLP